MNFNIHFSTASAAQDTPHLRGYRLAELLRDLLAELRFSAGDNVVGLVFTFMFSVRFRLLALYRIARFANLNHLGFLCPILKFRQHALCSCEISPNAILGQRIRVPHPTGIVIGDQVVVENDVCLFQGVTLGSHGRTGDQRSWPLIQHHARLYAGACVLGGVTVGSNAIVGANAVVIQDVPEGATAVGVPAHLLNPGERR